MSINPFEMYKARVVKTILDINGNANPVIHGDTLIRHYFNAGYSERCAATAVIEVVSR